MVISRSYGELYEKKTINILRGLPYDGNIGAIGAAYLFTYCLHINTPFSLSFDRIGGKQWLMQI